MVEEEDQTVDELDNGAVVVALTVLVNAVTVRGVVRGGRNMTVVEVGGIYTGLKFLQMARDDICVVVNDFSVPCEYNLNVKSAYCPYL